MSRMTVSLLCIGLLAATAAAEFGNPKDIPEAGRIRIDGSLSDWRKAEWTPLDETLDGSPAHISNARWSIAWDDTPMVYIVVQYDDAEIVLQDSTVSSNAQDSVEIYVRGDTGSDPEDYSLHQDSAQQYTFGLSKDRQVTWKKMGALEPFPAHNPAKAVVTLEGNRFTYEIAVPLYDSFDAVNRLKCSETELFLNEDDGFGGNIEIGIDIAIIDAGTAGYTGMKAENTLTGKRTDANQIAEHTLSD